jgi:hypothetical protein
LELETPAKAVPRVSEPELAVEPRRQSVFGWSLALFLLLWVAFYALQWGLPYVRNGSDIIFAAKLRMEQKAQIFPSDPQVERVLIFGNSKILAGFLPSLFDRMAATDGLRVSSFNSGFPGTDLFLPPLKEMCERGQAPNVLLLTLPWKVDPPPRDIFHLIPDDHAVVEWLFPFRYWLRDFTDFALSASSHGGFRGYYREAQNDEKQVIADRGRYLITEQSRFPGGRLPDDFHLASDQPDRIDPRPVPAHSEQIGELNGLIRQYHMRCFFLPYYLRVGEAAVPPDRDDGFSTIVEGAAPCRVLGPDYFLYPNALFSDQTHVNTAGARVYTSALYRLIANRLGDQLSQRRGDAFQ